MALFLFDGRAGAVRAFATRIGRDEPQRRELAVATGIDPQMFSQRAPEIVRSTRTLGHGFESPDDIARALEGAQ
jgi:hypothetical protein